MNEASHAVAALAYGIPIIGIDITAKTPHLSRGHYRSPPNLALESMCVLCLAGPAGEEYFCGRVNGGDEADYQMAREHLRCYCDPVMIGAGIKQARDAADRLVQTDWAQQRICLIATALLKHGRLTGEQILDLII